MIAMTLAEIATAVGGELIGGAQATDVAEPGDLVVEGSVETDSRLVRPGSVFFACPARSPTAGASCPPRSTPVPSW